MYFMALATDFDGTLSDDGILSPDIRTALVQFRMAGHKVILVTGREISDLKRTLPDLTIFDTIVAENGALLYQPATGTEQLLAPPPPLGFVEELKARGVAPLSVGRSVVATWEPHEATVLSVIHERGLDLQIIFNKGAVMIMPPGVSKASGLSAALSSFGMSAKNCVGVGDAENDLSFLALCGLSAAVANALPHVKESCDIKLSQSGGTGVIELIDRVRQEDAELAPLTRHGVLLGHCEAGVPVMLGPLDGHCLLVGPSASGKSTLATAMTEQMVAQGLSFCVLDPEGDYFELLHAACIGSATAPPSITDALRLKRDIGINLVINSQALTLAERRRAFHRLVVEASTMRRDTGRPHWLILDEAHEVVPPGIGILLPPDSPNAVFVTMLPESIDTQILRSINTIVAFGDTSCDLLSAFARITGHSLPPPTPKPKPDQVLLWRPQQPRPPFVVNPVPPQQPHHRHIGKYASGDVGSWHSFYFDGSYHHIARNLFEFVDIADSLNESTWLRHLRSGDYANWFHDVIHDDLLAQEARLIARDPDLSAEESRRRIKRAILRRYAAPYEHTR